MPEDHGVVRRVAWRQVCPWLILFRSFHLAISLPVLFLATIGVLLTPLGWKASELLFVSANDRATPGFAEAVAANSQWPMSPPRVIFPGEGPLDEGLSWNRLAGDANSLGYVYWRFASPFYHLLQDRLGFTQIAYWLFGSLWMIAVWSLVGGAITRLAAVKLGREERLGLVETVRYVFRNYFWYFLSPLFPIVGLLVTAIPVMLLGWLMRLDVGVFIAGLLWPLALLIGLVLVVFVLGLMFGWPLMFPSISSEEGSDSFEAFSRTYSYTFRRPLHYLFYAFVAMLFGGLSWYLVAYAAEYVIAMTVWAATWGAGSERIDQILTTSDESGVFAAGRFLIRLFSDLVRSIATAFNFAFFWIAATAIYLLLRRDVDQTDFDEVFVEGESDRYGLPPLPTPPGRDKAT